MVGEDDVDYYSTDNVTIEDLDACIKKLQETREQLVEGSKSNEYKEVK